MLGVERHRRVLQHLRVHGTADVADLATSLGVSASTVRRDLGELAERGLVTRVRGGASLSDSPVVESARARRAADHAFEKRRIGQAAASLVRDGDTVLISGGTTTEAMLPFLADRQGVTVLTNGLHVALGLAAVPGVDVVVLGGVVRPEEMSLLGPLVESTLAGFNVETAFCGAFGIDPVAGVSGAHALEASTDRAMLAAANRLVVLADASKFGHRGAVRLARADDVDLLVTDRGAPTAGVASFRMRGVDVRCV